MKRSLILSLCAVALVAVGINAVQAQVDIALNLNYIDPADPSEGGTWSLVAKSSTASSTGITGLRVRFLDMPAAGVVDGSIGHDINGGLLAIATFGSATEFVYGQNPGTDPNNDPAPLGLIANVGLSGGPSDQGSDPLFNSVWNNASVIATGSIANLTVRPSFVSDPNAPTAANENVSGTITASTIGLTNVRGDSVGVDGLSGGDVQRDWDVDSDDLGVLLNFFGSVAGTRTWDEGDLEGDNGDVGANDLGVLLNFFGTGQTPPAIGAVPEPTSAVLILMAVGVLGLRRRIT